MGLTEPVLATAIRSAVLLPWFFVLVRRQLPVQVADLAGEAWLPAYVIGAFIAVVVGVAGWGAHHRLCLNAGERNLIRTFLRRR